MCINLVDILVSKVGSKFNLVNVPILGYLLPLYNSFTLVPALFCIVSFFIYTGGAPGGWVWCIQAREKERKGEDKVAVRGGCRKWMVEERGLGWEG